MFMQLPFELRHLIFSELLNTENAFSINLMLKLSKESNQITHKFLKKCNAYNIQYLSNVCCRNGMLSLLKVILRYHQIILWL